jgi:GPI transamidase subunit PIG-U
MKPETSFFRSKLTVTFTIIRFFLAFNIGSSLKILQWINNAVVKSVLINPVFTLDHFLEANAIRHLLYNGPKRFADAYIVGSELHLPPLMLAVIEFLIELSPSSTLHWYTIQCRVILTIFDIIIAFKLAEIATKIFQLDESDSRETILMKNMPKTIYPELFHIFPIKSQHEYQVDPSLPESNTQQLTTTPMLQRKDLPRLIAELYYISPVTVLASSAIGSFQNVRLLFLCCSLSESLPGGSIVLTAFWLALASHCDIHLLLFLIPTVFFVIKRQGSSLLLIAAFVAYYTILHGLSYLLVGSSLSDYVRILVNTNGLSFQLHDLEPSLSMLWYLSMELFGRFRAYFTILLGGIPYTLIAPIVIRLYEYPAVLVRVFYLEFYEHLKKNLRLLDYFSCRWLSFGCLGSFSAHQQIYMTSILDCVSCCSLLVHLHECRK